MKRTVSSRNRAKKLVLDTHAEFPILRPWAEASRGKTCCSLLCTVLNSAGAEEVFNGFRETRDLVSEMELERTSCSISIQIAEALRSEGISAFPARQTQFTSGAERSKPNISPSLGVSKTRAPKFQVVFFFFLRGANASVCFFVIFATLPPPGTFA